MPALAGDAPFHLEFYRDEEGDEPVLDWLRSLDSPKRRAIGVAMHEILAKMGVEVCGTEFGKQLGQGLFEFRVRQSADQVLARAGHAKKGGGDGDEKSIGTSQSTGGETMTDFNDFYNDPREEAAAEGPQALAELEALEERYRLARTIIERRKTLQLSQKDLAAASGIDQATSAASNTDVPIRPSALFAHSHVLSAWHVCLAEVCEPAAEHRARRSRVAQASQFGRPRPAAEVPCIQAGRNVSVREPEV